MNSDRLTRWLSLAANLGLLLGLTLVAFEIRQNSQLARMQLVNEGNLGSNQIYGALRGENPMVAFSRSVEHPEEMTYEDYLVVDAVLYTMFNALYRNYELAREGIYEEIDWQEPLDNVAGWYLGSRFGRAWWAEQKLFFPEEFAAHADRRLATNPRDSHAYWRAIQQRLQPREEGAP